MVSAFDPGDPDRRRERVSRDILTRAERIAGSLDDESRRAQRLQVLRAETLGPAGRMEGITEADETEDAGLVRHHARDAPAERFAPDREPARPAESRDRREPALAQDGLPVGRSSGAAGPARAHVGGLETGHAGAARRNTPGHGREKWRAHRRPGAMGQDERQRSVWRAIEEEFRRIHASRPIIVRPDSGPGPRPVSARALSVLVFPDLRF